MFIKLARNFEGLAAVGTCIAVCWVHVLLESGGGVERRTFAEFASEMMNWIEVAEIGVQIFEDIRAFSAMKTVNCFSVSLDRCAAFKSCSCTFITRVGLLVYWDFVGLQNGPVFKPTRTQIAYDTMFQTVMLNDSRKVIGDVLAIRTLERVGQGSMFFEICWGTKDFGAVCALEYVCSRVMFREEDWAVESVLAFRTVEDVCEGMMLFQAISTLEILETFLAHELVSTLFMLFPELRSVEWHGAVFAHEYVCGVKVVCLLGGGIEDLWTFDAFEDVLLLKMLLHRCLVPENSLTLGAFVCVYCSLMHLTGTFSFESW